jgi:uncharacterized membrane protein YqhA
MFRLCYITIVPSACSFIGALLMFCLGAAKTFKAAQAFVLPASAEGTRFPSYLDSSERATIYMVESMDVFLVGLVLLVFSLGVYTLFIGDIKFPAGAQRFAWMRIHSIERLKQVLMEVVLVVLAVLFLRIALFEAEQLQWVLLVLPAGIALMALAMRLVGWRELRKAESDD